MTRPQVIVLAGPNGAGKSTMAGPLLSGAFGVDQFVNADTIATGLSGLRPEQSAFAAGRIMVRRVKELGAQKADFGFETTLASRSFAPWLRGLKASGYVLHLLYLWLPSADMAVMRVQQRVRLGGHNVPEETVRRRYRRGLRNFFTTYQELADHWRFLDNSTVPRLLAEGSGTRVETLRDVQQWTLLRKEYAS
jgi:predicted ABC-type ATPase